MKKILFVLVLALAAIANAQAQDPQARRIFSTTTVASDIGILETGGGVQYHQIIWNVSGSVPTCTVSLDSSTDGITWSTGGVIAGQTCTSNGASTVSALTVANYVRINVTTKSGAGIVTVTYLGYTAVPGGGGGGSVTGCTTTGGVAYENGTNNTLTCGSAFTWDPVTAGLSITGPNGQFEVMGPNLYNGGAGVELASSVFGSGAVTVAQCSPAPCQSLDFGLGSGNIGGFTGAGNVSLLYNATTGVLSWGGTSTGNAGIGVAAAAGNPSTILLPTTDPTIFHSFLVSNVTGGSNVTSWAVPGVSINAQTGTSYTLGASSSSTLGDRGAIVTDSNVGATAVTLPQAGTTGYANSYYFGLFNINSGLVTITPTTSTINGNATQIVPNHWGSFVYSDNVNYRSLTVPDISVFPNSPTNALGFTSATGVFGSITALTATSFGCGVLNTTSCVITGDGSTSGTATLTWPAVAGTAGNPIASSNSIQVPVGTAALPSLQIANGGGTMGFYASGNNSLATIINGVANIVTASSIDRMTSAMTLGWAAGSPTSGVSDTNISRQAAGVMEIGTGETQNALGSLLATNVSAATLTSTVALGTAPLTVTSATPVANLQPAFLRATMTADWTCGTTGTVASCTSATIVGSTGTAMTITLPLAALSWDFDCDGVVTTTTASPANNWNLITATNGATNVTVSYMMGTAAAVGGFGATTDQGSTTSTFNIGGTWTLGGTGTKFPFHIHARIEGASASGTVVSLQVVDPTVGDLLTIYRGTSCWAHQ